MLIWKIINYKLCFNEIKTCTFCLQMFCKSIQHRYKRNYSMYNIFHLKMGKISRIITTQKITITINNEIAFYLIKEKVNKKSNI